MVANFVSGLSLLCLSQALIQQAVPPFHYVPFFFPAIPALQTGIAATCKKVSTAATIILGSHACAYLGWRATTGSEKAYPNLDYVIYAAALTAAFLSGRFFNQILVRAENGDPRDNVVVLPAGNSEESSSLLPSPAV